MSEQELSRDDVLGGDFDFSEEAEGDSFEQEAEQPLQVDYTPEPEAPEQPQPTPQPEQPAPVAQAQPEPEPKYLTQEDFGRAMAALKREEAAKREQLEAFYRSQLQAPEPVEPPDPITDPEGYREHLRQEVLNEVAPHIQQVQYTQANLMYQQSLQLAASTVGHDQFRAYAAKCEEFVSRYPSIVNDIQSSENPGLRIIELGRMLEAQAAAPGGATAATAPQSVDREALKQELLKEIAAEQARQGVTPQNRGPVGVGSGAAGAGVEDALPDPIQAARLARSNPAAYADYKRSILGL